jgi:hypothetical protein
MHTSFDDFAARKAVADRGFGAGLGECVEAGAVT